MAIRRSSSLRLGIFVTLAIGLFITALLILGRKQNLFQSTVRISTEFKDVQGLKIGNKVRFTGIETGNVVNMTIIADTSVLVEMSIQEEIVPYIKKNSVATIGNEGLMGNKIVIIMPGTPGAESVKRGDKIPSIEQVEIDDIMNEVMKSGQKISIVADNLINITDKIDKGEGIFGKIFTDTSFTRDLDKSARNLTSITHELDDILGKVNRGEGVLGKIFADTLFARKLDSASYSIEEIFQNFEDITRKINQGEGIFGRLFTDTTISNNLYYASRDLQQITGNLVEVTSKINSQDNVLSKIIADPAFADSLEVMMQRLNEGLIEATEASEAIKRSGLIRLFSKKKENGKGKKEDEEQ